MRPAAPLLAAILLTGCAHRSPYAPPQVALPAAFHNAPADTPASPATSRWWTAFNDPTLDRLIVGALAGSPDVDAAAARLRQAAAGVRTARAERLPFLGFDASAARRSQSVREPLGRFASQLPGYQRTSESYGLNAAAGWEVDLFGRLSAGARAARADAQAADAGTAGARLTVAAEVATAYLDARELQARIAIARDRAATLAGLDRIVQLRFARGLAARLEADQVAADLATARAAVPTLRAALEVALNRIDLLSGVAPGRAGALIGEGGIPAAPAIAVQDGPAALLFRRPDLVAAERAVAAADARAAQALAERFPRLTLSALFGFLSTGAGTLFAAGAAQSSVGAGLAGPLFDFGRARAGVEANRGRADEAVADYRRAVLRAAGEVEDGLSALARRREQAALLAQAEAALAGARDASRRAYGAGAVSLIEALDAERRLQGAQDGRATADADAARAAVATFRALGGDHDAAEARTLTEHRGIHPPSG